MLLSLFSLPDLNAQGLIWSEHYELTGTYGEGMEVVNTKEGGFALTGFVADSGSFPFTGYRDLFIVKTDPFGDTLWTRTFPKVGNQITGGLVATADSGLVMTGTINSGQIWMVKLDQMGNISWQDSLTDTLVYESASVHELGNGDLVVWGTAYPGVVAGYSVLTKIDANGVFIRDTVLPESARRIELTAAEELFLPLNDGSGSQVWTLVDTAFNVVWSNTFSTFPGKETIDVDEMKDGGFAIMVGDWSGVGGIYNKGTVVRTDVAGNIVWYEDFSGYPAHLMQGLAATPDTGIIATGIFYKPFLGPLVADCTDVVVTKFDGAGAIDWDLQYHTTYEDYGTEIKTVSSGGYIITGHRSALPSMSQHHPALWRLDGNSLDVGNLIYGTYYADLNGNCVQDSGEYGIPHQYTLVNGPTTYFGSSDSSGYYQAWADSGAYTVTNYPGFWSYWELAGCAADTINHVFPSSSGDSLLINWPLDFTHICPELHVSMVTPFVRTCGTGWYHVQVCNTGTAPADSAFATVIIDTALTVTGSTIPWRTPQSGNVYQFDVGTIPVGGCSYFNINYSRSCTDLMTLGQSVCSSVHVYPDTICVPADSSWDSSSISLALRCVGGDTVEFEIRNTGSGNMLAPGGFTVVEDNILRMNDTFLLSSGGIKLLTQAATGGAWLFEADQCPGHPGMSHPTVGMEGCGSSGFSLGFLETWPVDDADYFIDIDCQSVIGSYDPNDKTGYPTGVEVQNYIEANQHLEYKIRFQNTGTDTAFKVVIRDTLPGTLIPGSIIPGVSSHPYTFRLYGPGIAEFTFDPIALIDSGTNEAESNGFVMFQIQQQKDNPIGTVIENSAAIYFDYNPPIITNTSLHTIGEDFWITLDVEDPFTIHLEIKAFPNPFRDNVSFEWKEGLFNDVHLDVFDLSGKLVRMENSNEDGRMKMNRGTLNEGIYIYRMIGDGELMGSGKIVVK